MAKEGIDAFLLNCQLDEKFELIEAEFGLKGFAIVVKLLQRIYGEHGYYCEFNDDIALLLSRSFGLDSREDKNLIKEIVKASIRRGIFNENMFQKNGILTSKGIQERYLNVVRNRKEIFIKKDYLLFNCDQKKENVVIISSSDVRIGKNDVSFDTSKVKESKVNKNINVGKEPTLPKQIIDYLNAVTNSRYSYSAKATASHINARISEGHTLEEFKKVIDIKYAEWHDTEWEKFLRPETLFGPKFEGYLNQKNVKKTQSKNTNKFNNFDQRKYDYTDLEKQLIAR